MERSGKCAYPTSRRQALYCQNLYNKSYFEAARRVQKRSLLGVNEHFADKADAKRALLDRLLRGNVKLE